MTISIFVIPIVTIALFVFFSVLGMMLWMRQRRRERTVFVPPRNILMPMQPMQPMNFNNVNPQYRTPMSVTQPTPLQYPYVANSMPIPQPFSPAPITVPTTVPTTTAPNPPSSDLMDRMRQVQMLMVEIHRLESEPREENHHRLQQLKQRVAELSATDGHTPSAPDSFQPPPAYPSDVKHSIGRPEYGAAGRG